MSRARLLAVLVLAGCASVHSTAIKPSVKVVVTADQAVTRFVDSDRIVELTEAAVRKHASDAAPVTVQMHFTSLAVQPPDRGWEMASVSQQRHAVAVVSPEPLDEPGVPTVASAPSGLASSRMLGSGFAQVVVGTYTISDAAGNVLEQKPISIRMDGVDSQRLDDTYWVTRYVAGRVAELARKSG